MYQKTYERILDLALYIERFRELSDDDKSWLIELLKNGRAVIACLELLDTLSNESLNYNELAARLGCSEETARQRLNALVNGGIAIKQTKDFRYHAPDPTNGGRYRKLSRVTSSKKQSHIK